MVKAFKNIYKYIYIYIYRYDVIATSAEIIMVIEYAGEELFTYIVEKKRLGEDEARRFFQQLIGAVEYCHQRKMYE